MAFGGDARGTVLPRPPPPPRPTYRTGGFSHDAQYEPPLGSSKNKEKEKHPATRSHLAMYTTTTHEKRESRPEASTPLLGPYVLTRVQKMYHSPRGLLTVVQNHIALSPRFLDTFFNSGVAECLQHTVFYK